MDLLPRPALPAALPAAEPAAPPHPRGGWTREVGWHLAFALVAAAAMAAGLRLDLVDIRVPFADGWDTLPILPMVKATFERGSHWCNERYDPPVGQALYYF